MENNRSEITENDDNDTSGSIDILPDDVLEVIFLMLPGRDVSNAVRVCKRWKYLIDNELFWSKKCSKSNKNLRLRLEKLDYSWRKFAKLIYCSNFYDRNMLKNPRGNKQFDYWCIYSNASISLRDTKQLQSADNMRKLIEFYKSNQVVRLASKNNSYEKAKTVPIPNWRVEINQTYLTNKDQYMFDSFKTKGFGEKMQVMDLAREGLGLYPTLLEEFKPDIEVYEYYRVHNSECCEYYLSVFLVSESFELIDSFLFRDKTEHAHSDWKCVYYKFLNSDLGEKNLVRYIIFYHAGRVSFFYFDLILLI